MVTPTPEKPSAEKGWTLYHRRLENRIQRKLEQGRVPLAIADAERISDAMLRRRIRSLQRQGRVPPLPEYLSLDGPEREPRLCPHCGKEA